MKRFVRVLAVAMCATMIFSGCSSSDGETATAAVKKTSVEVMKADKGELKNESTYSGKLAASEEANLVCMVSGKVDKVYFDIGDEVRAGDILFTMDNDSYVNNLSSASASLKAAEAALAGAELALKNAETAFENNKVLYEAGAISKASFDQIELSYQQAKIGVDSSLAQKEAAAAQVATLQDTIDESVVESPIDGVVTACNVKAGEVLNQSNGYPFSVMNMSKMTVKVSVSGSIINKLNKGDTVSVKVTTVSSDSIEGVIKTVNPAANYSGTYDVEIEIDNETGFIKSGMFAEVSFLDEKAEEVFVVPKNVIFSEGERSYVFVNEGGVAVKKYVETSIDNGEDVGITSGINVGDEIIVKGHNYVEDGSEVSVVNGEE